MAASKFTRNKDYSDEADNNAGGRDTVDPAGLDGEMDELAVVTGDHADKLDTLLRDDLQMVASILQGHEFSTKAITVLASLLGTLTALGWTGPWVTTTPYLVGQMVSINGNSYICIEAHTAGAFATDLAEPYWEIVAEKGSGAFPGGATADDLLYYSGAAEAWGKLTAAMAPLHALLADPTFTGVVGLPDVNLAGRFNASIEDVTFNAAGNAFDFDTEFLKRIDVTGNYTGACTLVNATEGDVMEIHFRNQAGTDATLIWDPSINWMGYAPSVLPAGKRATLSIRALWTWPTALWSVEP